MIKAIFTNIKDEHRYLESWIEYHIRIGINLFIIYEDEGSKSHSSIISKYSNVCRIDFYDYVLKNDSDEFKDLTCFKHIFDNYTDIDWLIKIDPDEYIILPSDCSSIDDILYPESQKDINQIYLSWKLYNANGFIDSPYPGKYNIKDTYLMPIRYEDLNKDFKANTSNNDYNLGKSFINYKKYKTSFESRLNPNLISIAFPHFIFNEPKTEEVNGFVINHYITKSFEEFYERLKDKGEYNPIYYRKLGDFFILNPDLIPSIPSIENKYNVNVFDFNTKINSKILNLNE